MLPPLSAAPVLATERLRLRPFTLGDAPEVQRLAGAHEIAATTLRIPHPYPDGVAEAWILSQRGAFARGEELALAVVRREDNALVGAISLMLRREDEQGELGYWIGRPYWGLGYATEAGRALVAYGFGVLGLQRIHACHFGGNPASGRVLRKLGLAHEGRQRRHLRKWGRFQDLELYGILREEYLQQATLATAQTAATAVIPGSGTIELPGDAATEP